MEFTGKIARRQWLTVCGLPAFASGSRGQSTVDSEIRSLAAEAPLSMQFRGSTEAECRRWQQTFAAKLQELLGPFDPPARWETIRERTVDFDDHARDELVLPPQGHPHLPAYLPPPQPTPPHHHPPVP